VAQTLFNQPHSARAAVPWQPHVGIAQKLSRRGYATTSWTDELPADFADLGLPPKASGFSAAHYQPTKQHLSQQAQASLALLDGEYRNDSLGEGPSSAAKAEEDPNAHLPFVSDAYAATRKSKLRVQVDPSVLQRALAQAELAESLVVSPITSDDNSADLIVIHPDERDEESTDVTDVEPKNAADEGVVAEQEEFEEPELPMVAGGVSPEEVAQREAEQFAKGMAQAREEASAELTEAVRRATEEAKSQGMAQAREDLLNEHAEALRQATEEARTQALEQGKEEGLAEGLAQGKEEGYAQGLAEGKDIGLAEGEEKVRSELMQQMTEQREVFEQAAHALHEVIGDPQKFFEPLKRLTMHLAEQVVLGELQTSSKAIERLVQRCLDELDHPVRGAVVVELNPLDKDVLQVEGADFIKGMRLEAVHEMQRGSVRVFANDTVIEDLVGHRLDSLAKALLSDVDAWREHSTLMRPPSMDKPQTEAVATAHMPTEQEITDVVEDDDVHS
jgi:flagellar biosynthesis/type III secretory pathway protein FliH